jgi:hypothetical protein
MHIQQSARDGCIVVTLTGDLDIAAAPKVQRPLLNGLDDQPSLDANSTLLRPPNSARCLARLPDHRCRPTGSGSDQRSGLLGDLPAGSRQAVAGGLRF